MSNVHCREDTIRNENLFFLLKSLTCSISFVIKFLLLWFYEKDTFWNSIFIFLFRVHMNIRQLLKFFLCQHEIFKNAIIKALHMFFYILRTTTPIKTVWAILSTKRKSPAIFYYIIIIVLFYPLHYIGSCPITVKRKKKVLMASLSVA